MRRILMGTLWFLVLYFGTMMLIGGILGAMAGMAAEPPVGSADARFQAAFVAGEQAGAAFREAWGEWILLAALVVAFRGSQNGWLPGTRPREVDLASRSARAA